MDNYLWDEKPFTHAQAWIDMLMLTNYKTGHIRPRGILVHINRGQLGWSRERLAKRWGWSRGKVKRFLSELETAGQIEQQKSNVTSLITIINYEQYQTGDTTDRATDGQQTDNRRTTDGQQTDTNNKDKKVNKEKNVKNKEYISPQLGEHENVLLTEIEHNKLIEKYGISKISEMIDRLSGYIASTGKRYKSHYATMLNWIRGDTKKAKNKGNNNQAYKDFLEGQNAEQ